MALAYGRKKEQTHEIKKTPYRRLQNVQRF
jgi:hypothetical protein